jgi:hypothetical protein
VKTGQNGSGAGKGKAAPHTGTAAAIFLLYGRAGKAGVRGLLRATGQARGDDGVAVLIRLSAAVSSKYFSL